MSVTDCKWTEDAVLGFVAGELEEGVELEVARHLGECEACCDRAVEFRALGVTLEECCPRSAIRWHAFATPFGRMYVAASDDGLVRISWQQKSDEAFAAQLRERFAGHEVVADPDVLAEAERQLREYFDGERSDFDLAVDLASLSDFQQAVLREVAEVGFGEVIPYSELARRIGRPRASRAVGNALGRNPVGIVIPCHRVVRRDRSLGGYGGGVEYKEKLLELEGREDLLRAG